ncbi:MAG: hypothetical protein HOP17_00585, partial [Acidobacteria bacterium]|nr:hypothetical protein [Acidobacteriota bacterium]
MFLLVFPVGAFVWTLVHFAKTPPEKQLARGADVMVCIFILFSLLIIAGQAAGQITGDSMGVLLMLMTICGLIVAAVLLA